MTRSGRLCELTTRSSRSKVTIATPAGVCRLWANAAIFCNSAGHDRVFGHRRGQSAAERKQTSAGTAVGPRWSTIRSADGDLGIE
jgi:hypothetical protein